MHREVIARMISRVKEKYKDFPFLHMLACFLYLRKYTDLGTSTYFSCTVHTRSLPLK